MGRHKSVHPARTERPANDYQEKDQTPEGFHPGLRDRGGVGQLQLVALDAQAKGASTKVVSQATGPVSRHGIEIECRVVKTGYPETGNHDGPSMVAGVIEVDRIAIRIGFIVILAPMAFRIMRRTGRV